jgi:UDP-glucose 4-epimerase
MERMPSNSVLVTGGAGYIGSHAILELMAGGYQPVVLDDLSTGVRAAVPENVPFYDGAVGNSPLLKEIIARHDVSAVMHFAGSIVVPESVTNPLKYYENNTVSTLHLIHAALEARINRFIFSSTAAVYGVPASSPVDEGAPTQPINPYGSSKLMSEQMLRDAAAANPAFRPIALRYFNVAGADPEGRAGQQGPNTTHLVRAAVEVALGVRPMLQIFGTDYPTRDGTCERDYIHVTDLAAAHVSALRYLETGGASVTLNCGYGRGHTILEVVAGLEKMLGRKLPTSKAPRRPGDPPSLVSKADRIREVLGWRPKHADLSEIIGTALRWQEKIAGGAKVRSA